MWQWESEIKKVKLVNHSFGEPKDEEAHYLVEAL